MIAGQVFFREETAQFPVVGHYLAAEFTGVDVIAGGLEGGFPAPAPAGFLHLRHPGQSGRQVPLVEHLPLLGSAATGQEDLGGRGIGIVGLEGGYEPACQIAVHGETVPGQIDGGFRHLAEGHGAEPGEGGDPRVGGRRGQGPEHSGRELAAMVLLEIVHRGRLRPHPQTVYLHNFPAAGQVHDRGRDAQEAAIVDMHHVQRQAHGHSGVDGVATLSQNVQPGHGGGGMTGGHHAVGALHQWPKTGQRGSLDWHRGSSKI